MGIFKWILAYHSLRIKVRSGFYFPNENTFCIVEFHSNSRPAYRHHMLLTNIPFISASLLWLANKLGPRLKVYVSTAGRMAPIVMGWNKMYTVGVNTDAPVMLSCILSPVTRVFIYFKKGIKCVTICIELRFNEK